MEYLGAFDGACINSWGTGGNVEKHGSQAIH